MQCSRDQLDRRADKVKVDFLDFLLCWCRGHELGCDTTKERHQKNRDDSNLDAISVAVNDDATQDRACKNCYIGPGFDQSGTAQNFILLQMLREHRIFDGTKKRGLQSKKEQRGQHDRNRM